MRPKMLIRRVHRYMALLIGTQLLLWTGSGFYFSLMPIDSIRGQDLVHPSQRLGDIVLHDLQSPAAAWAALQSRTAAEVLQDFELVRQGGEIWYRFVYLPERAGQPTGATDILPRRGLVNAHSLAISDPVTASRAEMLAQGYFRPTAAVVSVTRVEQVEADSEYRGHPLPAWRVEFDYPERPVLWLDADTGALQAVRVDRWRIFDFLWMLHILDFETRDEFNHLLLQVMAGLGILTILSGFALWLSTTRLFRRTRVNRASGRISAR